MITLCMVVRDCEETLRPLLKSVRPHVERIVIALGGPSTDRTEKVARKYGDIVFPIKWGDDWAKARNRPLEYVTTPYWIWLDGDDELEGVENLAETVEMMERRGLGRCDLPYLYEFDEHGNCTVIHQRERIMRTDLNWRWEDRVHETCHTSEPHNMTYSDRVKVLHRRPAGAPNQSHRNLPILLEMMKEQGTPRTVLAVGHAYFSLGELDAAQRYYTLYCENPEDDMNHWSAAVMAAKCCFQRQDWVGVQSWCMVALGITPEYKEPYTYLAHAVWWGERSAEKTLAWVARANAALEAPLGIFRNPLDYSVNLWDVEHRALAAQERYREARDCAEQAFILVPTHPWKHTLDFYEEAVRSEDSVLAAFRLCDHAARRGDLIRARAIIDLLPQTARVDRRIDVLRERVEGWLGGAYAPDETYGKDDKQLDLTCEAGELKRVQWYIERLRARGAKTVLEVGCHTGDVSRALRDAGFAVTGIDINPHAIRRAKELADDMDFRHCALDGVNEKFDAVLLAEILEHLAPTDQVKMLIQADERAPLVLGSVPAEFLAYGKGLFEVDDVRPFKGHVFEFAQSDLERLILTSERHVVNCHKVLDEEPMEGSPGFGNRVFEYDSKWPAGIGITFYLGESPERWTPRSIDEGGLGGSETSAALLAEELAARGHRVMVYAHEEGVYNGVVYRHYNKFDPQEPRDVLIVSRMPWMLEERPNAQLVYLWCHDTGYGEHFNETTAANVDKVVVLSEWQRGHWREAYPWLDETKLCIIGDGTRFLPQPDVLRQRHRFVYSSSPDRGLDDLLALWPLIRQMWDDAELHVFYGFNYLDRWAERDPSRRAYKNRVVRAARQPGVFLRGRVGQRELREELERSQFWLYPSKCPDGRDWYETFCIAAMEAQAAGCIPVTRRVGALPERVPFDECFDDEWSNDSILGKLRWWDEHGDEAWRSKLREYADRPEHGWPAKADQWMELIDAHIRNPQA